MYCSANKRHIYYFGKTSISFGESSYSPKKSFSILLSLDNI